jgi:hypothetical protein
MRVGDIVHDVGASQLSSATYVIDHAGQACILSRNARRADCRVCAPRSLATRLHRGLPSNACSEVAVMPTSSWARTAQHVDGSGGGAGRVCLTLRSSTPSS